MWKKTFFFYLSDCSYLLFKLTDVGDTCSELRKKPLEQNLLEHFYSWSTNICWVSKPAELQLEQNVFCFVF